MALYLSGVYFASMATSVGPTMQAPPATAPKMPLMKPVTGTYCSSSATALAYPVEFPNPASEAVASTSTLLMWPCMTRGRALPSREKGVLQSSSTAGLVQRDTRAPATRPRVKDPQNMELASAASPSARSTSLPAYVKIQLPMAVSAAVVKKTRSTTALTTTSSRVLSLLCLAWWWLCVLSFGGEGDRTKRKGTEESTETPPTSQKTARGVPA
mmetsp:Transcript_22003/g.48031  ORF Transcript_22003/g.48031 Transcript_22003/m.48031 type:complete len:213 (-) Transcript_22003:755-1393(-)